MSYVVPGYDLNPAPIDWASARDYVGDYHRHTKPPAGWLFGIAAVTDGGALVGVAICSRPVSRHLDDGWSAEVSRVCTDGYLGACSFLYARSAWALMERGYRRVITYTLERETGHSLVSAGWKPQHVSPGGEWHSEKRPREAAESPGPKQAWLAPGAVWRTPSLPPPRYVPDDAASPHPSLFDQPSGPVLMERMIETDTPNP